jgi:hypothetical protein
MKFWFAIAALALGLAPLEADAAAAYITSSFAGQQTSSGTPTPAVTTGAAIAQNALIKTCGVVYAAETISSAPTDNKGNTYTAFEATAPTDGGTGTFNCYAANNTAVSGTVTVTWHFTGVTDNSYITVEGFTGLATSSFIISHNKLSAQTTNTAHACATSTPNATGQLDTGFVALAGASTSITGAASYTQRGSVGNQVAVADKATADGTTAVAPSFTSGNTQIWGCVHAIMGLLVTTPTFSSGPTYAKVDNNTIRATFTCSAAGSTARIGLYVLGASTPTAAQVAAGTNAHGTANAACTGSSQTLDVDSTDNPVFPGMDPYLILDAGGANFSVVPSTTSTCFDPPASRQFSNCPAGLTAVNTVGSVPAGFNALVIQTIAHGAVTSGPFTQYGIVTGSTSNAYGVIQLDAANVMTLWKLSGTFQNGEVIRDNHGAFATTSGAPAAYVTIATTDILASNTTVSPSGATLTQPSTDGQFSYDMGATGRQLALGGLIYDRSAGAYMTIGFDFVDQNATPVAIGNPAVVLVFKTGVAISTTNMTSYCNDAEGDALQFGRVGSVALPTGLSMTYLGVLTGTPTVENESGAALTILCMDPYQAYLPMTVTIYPITDIPMVNCTSPALTDSACRTAESAAMHQAVNYATGAPVYSNTVPAGYVASTSPASGGPVAPGDVVTITLSQGPQGKNTHRRGTSAHGVSPFF